MRGHLPQNQNHTHSRNLTCKALTISLGLHALLLLQTPWESLNPAESARPDQPTPAIEAHLSNHRPHEKAIERSPEKPTPANTSSSHPLPRNRQTTPLLTQSQEINLTNSTNSPQLAANEVTKQIVKPAPPKMSDTPVSQEKSTDTASLRQYRFDLAVAARRFREVSSALEGRKSSGVTARAGVRVEIDEESQAHHPLVSLQSSSGDSALDQAALTILSNAARITPIPPTLRGKPIAVILRVEFDSHLPSGR